MKDLSFLTLLSRHIGLADRMSACFVVRHFNSTAPQEQAVAMADPKAPILAPEDEVHAKYAGSESCKKCHLLPLKNGATPTTAELSASSPSKMS